MSQSNERYFKVTPCTIVVYVLNIWWKMAQSSEIFVSLPSPNPGSATDVNLKSDCVALAPIIINYWYPVNYHINHQIWLIACYCSTYQIMVHFLHCSCIVVILTVMIYIQYNYLLFPLNCQEYYLSSILHQSDGFSKYNCKKYNVNKCFIHLQIIRNIFLQRSWLAELACKIFILFKF